MSYKPPKDRIPGLSSYLHEAHRWREPHEFADYWKTAKRTKARAKKLGLSTNLESLINHVVNLGEEVKHATTEHQLMEELYTKEEKKARQWAQSAADLATEMNSLKPQIEHLEQQLYHWLDIVMDHGEHLDDCGWIELIGSGRVVNAKEEEYCTCGWYRKRMELKKDPRYKSSRPAEVIEKKKPQVRDLDI